MRRYKMRYQNLYAYHSLKNGLTELANKEIRRVIEETVRVNREN